MKKILLSILLTTFLFSEEIYPYFSDMKKQFSILNTNWQTIETDKFIIYYPTGYDWEANQVLQNLEYYHDNIVKLTGNDPGKIPIVIEDLGIWPNGYADSWQNKIHIFTYTSGDDHTQSWFRRVAIHEFTHIGHMANVKGGAKLIRCLFGKTFQPNLISPAWVIEGITVFSESQQSPYEGRLNDGYFNAVIASKAKEKKIPSIRASTNLVPTYPLGDWYLNGGMFFNYLSNTYGKEKIPTFFNRYGTYWWAPTIVGFPFPGFGIDLAAKKVYGKSIKNLYKDWTDFEEERYKNWKVDGQKLTNSGWYKSFLRVYDDKIYYFNTYYNKIDIGFIQIIEFNPLNKKEKVIAHLTNSISSPIQIQNGQVYYIVKELEIGYANVSTFGTTSILYSMDINTGKRREVFTDDIRAFCILDNGDILYSKDQKHHFGSELWIYSYGEKLKIGITDQLISEFEAENGEIFVVSREDFENWNVNQLNLDNITFSSIANSPWAEASIHLQNNKIIYTTNHENVYSIFSYDLTNKSTYKLTNEGYSVEGVVIEDSLYFVGLSSKGEDIFVKPLNLIEWESPTWEKSIRPQFSLLNLNPKKGKYSSNLKKMFNPYTHMFYPNIENERIGIEFWGADVLGQNSYQLGIEYSSKENKFHFNTWFESKIFAPFYFSTYTNYDDSLSLSSTYPLYITSRPGLSSLWIGLSVTLSDKYLENKTIRPYINADYRYPLTSFGISTSIPIKKTIWKNKADDVGLEISSWISQKTRFGYLGISSMVEYSNTELIIFSNRGKGELHSPFGVTISPSYSVQLLKFRRGFWNVNMFIEDFNGELFVDYTIVKNEEYLSAFGGEIGIESRILFSALRFSPTFGAAINKKGEWNYYWELQFQ